jgi:aryl carrier-like protein
MVISEKLKKHIVNLLRKSITKVVLRHLLVDFGLDSIKHIVFNECYRTFLETFVKIEYNMA